MTPTRTLHLSKDLALPLDAATETFAILGRRGSGKTHTAVVMAEEMLGAGIPIVVIDPLDVWWGLRVSKDGKRAGLPIYVAGGSHPDIPLSADAGRVIADAVVDKGFSIVLSIRHLSKTDQRRFVGDFCERLYDRKADPKHRTALHVFIDEADAFVPQRLMPGAERCFGAVDTLVRRGRSSGLAPTLISQRPQVINKDVLSQTEVLVSHQLTGPQDRKALQTWIEANDTEHQGGTFMASLASLDKGQAWFWSPGLLRVFMRVTVRDRQTFDSSATPKAGVVAVASPKAFAAVDLDALTAEIAATIEKAKADDPRELRKLLQEKDRKIQSLEKAASGSSTSNAVRKQEVKTVEKPVLKDGQLARAEQLVAKLDAIAEKFSTFEEDLRVTAKEIRDAIASTRQPATVTSGRNYSEPIPRHPAGTRAGTLDRSSAATRQAETRAPRVPDRPGVAGELTGPERRILDAIGWLTAIGVTEPEQPAVAFLAGYTYNAGGFNNPKARLRAKAMIDYLPNDRVRLTEKGAAAATPLDTPLTTEALHQRVLSVLPNPEQRILTPLLQAWPNAIVNDELARLANYAPNTGGFNNPRGRLRSLGLLDYPQPGHVRARDILFPESTR